MRGQLILGTAEAIRSPSAVTSASSCTPGPLMYSSMLPVRYRRQSNVSSHTRRTVREPSAATSKPGPQRVGHPVPGRRVRTFDHELAKLLGQRPPPQ